MNISPKIFEKIGKNLHLKNNHPIEIIKRIIYEEFPNFEKFDDFCPVVNTQNNFDDLLIPKDHVARSLSDTYYINPNVVLRTHTSAHQSPLLKKGHRQFLVTGDVYRKDEINATHYPVFHQMEGVYICKEDEDPEIELKKTLDKIVSKLFPGCKYRINDDYFPFTNPSWEIEVEYRGDWLEILGCGVMQPKILKNAGFGGEKAWAFGLGLERLAMILFEIPDIRYFWSEAPQFSEQFETGDIVKFQEYSTLEPVTKDISFYMLDNNNSAESAWKNENEFYDVCRTECGDLLEKITLEDQFYNKKKSCWSHMYRLHYKCIDPKLNDPAVFNETVNTIQDKLREVVMSKLEIEIR